MRPSAVEVLGDIEEQQQGSASMAMDVDDVDPLEFMSGEQSVLSGLDNNASTNKLADADFFNKFEDDFDDSDIN